MLNIDEDIREQYLNLRTSNIRDINSVFFAQRTAALNLKTKNNIDLF